MTIVFEVPTAGRVVVSVTLYSLLQRRITKVKNKIAYKHVYRTVHSCRCAVLDMSESREMTEQTDWREKQPSQMACVSEPLRCSGTRNTTSGHNTKGITPSIPWKSGLERGSARRSSLEIFLERTRKSHSQSDQRWSCFTSGRRWGNFLKDGLKRIWAFPNYLILS